MILKADVSFAGMLFEGGVEFVRAAVRAFVLLAPLIEIMQAIDENRASRRILFIGADVRGLIMGRISIECEGII